MNIAILEDISPTFYDSDVNALPKEPNASPFTRRNLNFPFFLSNPRPILTDSAQGATYYSHPCAPWVERAEYTLKLLGDKSFTIATDIDSVYTVTAISVPLGESTAIFLGRVLASVSD